MSSHIQWLRKKLEAAQAERARIDEVVNAIATTIDFIEQQEGTEPQAANPAKELRNAMWKILQEEGQPLHYREIYRRLRIKDIDVPGKDPIKNTGAHLSNDERFKSLGGGKWALMSWQQPTPPVRGDQALDDDFDSDHTDVVITNDYDDIADNDFDDFQF